MNIKQIKITFARTIYFMVILAVVFSATTAAHAAGSSPFVGHWQAIDVDGSDIRLTIGGPPTGPFQITWTESYISFCNREAGIIRGTGQLNENDPNLLEADLHLKCFTTGASLDLHLVWRYHPAANTLSSSYGNGVITIWHRPGHPQLPPPALGLRVNYGHDWVESFYEGGHMAWVTVTESDGITVKATAELVTEPKEYWGGEPGFQTLDSTWFDGEGNPMENPPDIQPYDWVFGWVDNGASAQVQIGEISGTVHLATDSIEGTILAPWLTDPVQVECHDWGSGGEPFANKDGGFVLTNGEDPYSCSWSGEWDIQPYQNIGVGYLGSDGQWVANAFFARNPRIVASEAGDWFWTTDFSPGTLDLFIYESADEGAALLWQGALEADESGFAFAGYDVHGQNMVPGNYVVVSDGVNEKGLVLETISMEIFDTQNEIMAGTAPLGREVSAAAGPQEWQERIVVQADPGTGAWLADFKTIGFDITEDMRPWSFAQIYDEDGDANEASTPPAPSNPRLIAFPAVEQIFAYHWPEGSEVHLSINNPPDFTQTALVGPAPWDPNDIMAFFDFGGLYDLKPGDVITLSGSGMELTYTVLNLSVTNVDVTADTVSGTADPGTSVAVSRFEFGDQPLQVTASGDGNWLANFAEVGIDLVGGMCGRAEMYDESTDNSTAVDWCIPNPWLNAFPEWDIIYSYEWPANSEVNLTINGQFVQTVIVGPTSWDPTVYTAYFEFNGLYDLKPGDVVALSGSGMERTYTVQNLGVTAVDEDEDTVSGTADADAEVYVWPHATWQQLQVTADGEGNWQVDFTGVFDLVPGECGRAEIRDGVGNSTAVDWCLPKP